MAFPDSSHIPWFLRVWIVVLTRVKRKTVSEYLSSLDHPENYGNKGYNKENVD
jgi:hypothetical protein